MWSLSGNNNCCFSTQVSVPEIEIEIEIISISISETEPSSNIESITLYLKSLLEWSDFWTINFMITINLLPTLKDNLADSPNNSPKKLK